MVSSGAKSGIMLRKVTIFPSGDFKTITSWFFKISILNLPSAKRISFLSNSLSHSLETFWSSFSIFSVWGAFIHSVVYSFFSKDTLDYSYLFSQLKENDYVKIYNEGIKKTQNTIDIIQLEKGNKIIINKEIYNKKERGSAIFILIILILYFVFPIFFLIKSKYEEKKIHKLKITKTKQKS